MCTGQVLWENLKDLLPSIVVLVVAVVGGHQWLKRQKLDRYSRLIEALGGLYGRAPEELTWELVKAYHGLWMWGDDEMIRKFNGVLRYAGAKEDGKETEAEKQVREFILKCRKGVVGKTRLKGRDFLIIGPGGQGAGQSGQGAGR